MFEMDLAFFALAIPAVIFAGMSKGGFGSGAAFAASPILAMVLPPQVAVGVMLPLLMLADVTALGPYWKQWHWPSAWRIMLGAVPGVMLGALIFHAADPDVFKLLIGMVAVGFVAWQMALKYRLMRFRARPFPTYGGYIAGIVAGFTSFISHAGGPPVAVYMLSQNISKTAYQATTVLVFWVINLLKFIPYIYLGFFSVETWKADLYLAPFMVVGVLLGVKAHRVMPERWFFGLAYALLLMTGTKLIWDALT